MAFTVKVRVKVTFFNTLMAEAYKRLIDPTLE